MYKLFIKNFISNRKEVGAISPSSSFLGRKMVLENDIIKSKVIIELGAGTGVFTQEIFKYDLKDKKVFILEKNRDFYNILLKKYPKYKEYIYNMDLLYIKTLLKENNIEHIDLIISGLPFKSLPKNIFYFVLEELIKEYFKKESKFIQFSYFKKFKKDFSLYFNKVNVKRCWLNIPPAYVFECLDYKRK